MAPGWTPVYPVSGRIAHMGLRIGRVERLAVPAARHRDGGCEPVGTCRETR